jgi:hypothetical protein
MGQREEQKQKQVEILGIKEYGQKLQTSQDDTQKKQLSVQEQILQAIVKWRPDVMQAIGGGAVFS